MEEENPEGRRERLRRKLKQILAQCEGLLADAERRSRAERAPTAAPEELSRVHTRRQWAQDALAALDAGEPIPPLPSEGLWTRASPEHDAEPPAEK